jgi:hypothetical protein
VPPVKLHRRAVLGDEFLQWSDAGRFRVGLDTRWAIGVKHRHMTSVSPLELSQPAARIQAKLSIQIEKICLVGQVTPPLPSATAGALRTHTATYCPFSFARQMPTHL